MISLHHGRALRWSACPGDAVLEKASADFLVKWLGRRGVRNLGHQ